MKKILSFTLAVLFLAVMAAVAFAAETTFEGQYRVRAWSEWNFDKKAGYLPNEADPQYNGWFDQRFRLTITHKRSEFLKAVIRIDIADDTWGQNRAFNINNNVFGGKVDHAYIVATLPKLGTFTVGKQPIDFGYDLVFSADAPGVDGIKWENTWGPVTVAAMYFKLADRVSLGSLSPSYNRDGDMWALDLKFAPNDKHLINLFGGMVMNNTTWGPSLGGPWGSYDIAARYITYGAPVDASTTLGFVGLAYTGNIADMIDIKFEHSWVFGNMHINQFVPTVGGLPEETISIQGWNVYFDVSYYNDLLRVGLAFVMGSGKKHDWALTSLRNLNMPFIREENFGFANIIGNGYGGYNSVWLGPGLGDNAENLTAVKLYFEINPMEKLTLNAAVIWAKWTDPIGSGPNVADEMPAYPHPANWYSNYGPAFASWDASTDLGWEIDFGFNYQIMEGLDYTFAAGVLFTGDSWDYINAAGTREDWGAIWSINNVLRYRF